MLTASLITLTYNRPEGLRRCLESLSGQGVEKAYFELVLVDVSDEPVSHLVEEFSERVNIRHVIAENRGVAANRNVGARAASAPLLVFLDDDCRAETTWFERIMACASANPGALVGGGVGNMNPENAVSTTGQVITDAVDACSNSGADGPTFFPGMNFAVPRNDYIELGGCDESYGRLAAEDREFMARWRESGRPLVAEPGALVIHEHRMDLAGFIRQYFNYGRGAWVFHQRLRLKGGATLKRVANTHLDLLGHLGRPMSGLTVVMKAKVVLLLLVWELSNLAGFVWQAALAPGSQDGESERR